jgi:ABC-type dipeptide/oligopeptide/nickel transport system permease subunit
MKQLLKKPIVIFSLSIIAIYSLVTLLVALGLLAGNWSEEITTSYQKPSWDILFGSDIFGQSVFRKVIYSIKTAMLVGFISSTIALFLGVSLGFLAGYFGGYLDQCIVWLYTTFSSIPSIILLISIAMILGKGETTMYISVGLTSWVGLCRLVRGEVLKHKNREYVLAMKTFGASHLRKMRHIFPNIAHIIIINASLQFQTAIKSEVILSYIGLGAAGVPSWGTMIDDAKRELSQGIWWQLCFASIAMFFIILAFNLLSDSLRDFFDPKLKGLDLHAENK